MSALLWKEFYSLMYLPLSFLFLIASNSNQDSLLDIVFLFLGIFPAILCYSDRKDRWDITVRTMPFTIRQIISTKYLAGFLLCAMGLLPFGIVHLVRFFYGSFIPELFWIGLLVRVTCYLIAMSISLPAMFSRNSSLGIFLTVMPLLIMGISLFFISDSVGNLRDLFLQDPAGFQDVFRLVFSFCIISVTVMVFSWYIAIALYDSTEC